MESWIILVAVAQVFWVLGIYIDKHLVSTPAEDGDDHSVGALTLVSAFFNAVVALVIFAGLVGYYGFDDALTKIAFEPENLLRAILVGVMEILWLIPYFYASHYADEMTASPVFETIPVFAFALGFFAFGEVPTAVQIGASVVVLLGSLLLNMEVAGEDRAEEALENLRKRIGNTAFARLGEKRLEAFRESAAKRTSSTLNKKTFFLMLLASFIIALSAFLFKDSARDENFWGTTVWMMWGGATFGLVLWAVRPEYRRQFRAVLGKTKLLGLNLFNEVIDNVAIIAFYGAVMLGPLVGSVFLTNAYQPILVLLAGFTLARLGSHRHTKMLRGTHLKRRVVGILAVVVGSIVIFA